MRRISNRYTLFLGLILSSTAAAGPDQDFAQLLDSHWQKSKQEKVGFRSDPDAWRLSGALASVTTQARNRRQVFNEQMLRQLGAIQPQKLSRKNRVSYKIFLYERETERESYRQLDHLYPLTNRSGWHLSFANAPAAMTFSTLEDYETYLESLADFPRFNDEHIALLEQAIAAGHTQFCSSMVGFEHSISSEVVSDARQSSLYLPLANMPTTLAEESRLAIESRGRQLIEVAVIPAYRKLLHFYLQDYAPKCRTVEGITGLPGGEAYYQYLLQFFTTTDMSARDIHELGLSEVDRIMAEMEATIATADFQGSFKEFLHFLRTDPQFYSDDPEDLLEKTSRIAKRMDGQLPRLFATLPRLPYDIREIPTNIAEKTTSAYYQPAPGDGKTPGSYYVNTSLLASRPLYALEALSFHEAVPGHHLQMARALELDVPEFRRFLYHSAFGEGWGLYAEALGQEVGFYTNPYSNFGRLTYERWRACRLVVDTGLHAFGWSRQQAIDYMAARTALSIHEVTAEIDRYITWPAQATAYKIGELRIRALRKRAEKALGDRFDLRQFHDAVLANGSVPIAVLEELIEEWIAAQRIYTDEN
jgi:uncharacterized protein (DUF885 family)